ncbi:MULTISPECIES: hypothetical protein [unclassified Nocardia]|uniref:ATP-binding protein n=1 Tax=unclassified Nocardia TaxID=2637762 RepID=UPI001CE4225D|nr:MULTISPECIES: hypothetical protein [unclassified Nocardia]
MTVPAPPAAIGEFVGRAAELQRIEQLLPAPHARLITLVGPGGIGKTAVAAEAVRRYRKVSDRPVHWTRLARLAPGSTSEVIAEEVVKLVAKADMAGRSARDCLVEIFTRAGATLLVLDNCEHVVAGVGPFIIDLVEAVPGLTVITTSREPIGWLDEHLIAIPPLSGPNALTLFLRQAERNGRPIHGDAEHHDIAEKICGRVENNPLFIQLAAARLRHRPVAAVLRELTGDRDDKRMQWCHRWVGAERHGSVHDVIAWSYGLCTAEERLLLDRMSVFVTGFDIDCGGTCGGGAELAAITAVCADAALPADRIEHLVERLVERSLVSARSSVTTVRYYLLESVRVFARDRLGRRVDGLDEAALLDRHRRYYRDKVVAGQVLWCSPRQDDWIEWLRAAWENVLFAIESGLSEPTQAVVALETANTLMALRIPFITGANRAVMRLTERALAAVRDIESAVPLRVEAMALIGWIAVWQGRQLYTAQLLDECAAECLTDPVLRRTWRETAERDIGLPAAVECTWGLELLLVHHDRRAIDVLARARTKFEAMGDRAGMGRSELFESLAHSIVGEPEQAIAVARRHLDRAVDAAAGAAIAWAELGWMLALNAHGDPREAVRFGRFALERNMETDDLWTVSWFVHFLMVASKNLLAERIAAGAEPGELTAAATELAHVLGGMSTLHRSLGITPDRLIFPAKAIDAAARTAKSVLGASEYRAALRRGELLRPEHAELQRLLLGRFRIEQLPAAETASHWSELSPAEQEVAVLAAAGWPNSVIATRRGSSIRTVDAQVATIRRKLMVATRSEIIAHVPDELAERVRSESRQRPARRRPRQSPRPAIESMTPSS